MNNTLKFDGKSTYVEVEELESPTNNGGAITIEFWNKVDKPTRGFAFTFKNNQNHDRVSCFAPWSDDNKLYWDCGNPDHDKGGRLQIDYKPYLGQWTHIALVGAGSGSTGGDEKNPRMAIYIDGELKAHSAVSESPAHSLKGLVIGAFFDSNHTKYIYNHKGMIDGFRVWNRVRTQEEIKRDMHFEMIGDEEGLVACYNFNWGIQGMGGYTGKNYWADQFNTLPNSVEGSPDGKLNNFSLGSWVASGVAMKAPVGPVFHLKKTDSDAATGEDHFYTASRAEKAEKTAAGWSDEGIAFYAHRGPAPGTTPVYRLYNESEKHHFLTINSAERFTLDPRTKKSQIAGSWDYHGIIAYVSASQNGDAVALNKGYNPTTKSHIYTTDVKDIKDGYLRKGVACYVLPGQDKNYEPKPIEFGSNGLSEQLWYALLCRSYKEKWGLQLNSQGNLAMAEIPQTGACKEFQWRVQGNRLINRAYPDKVLVINASQAGTATNNEQDATQGWELRSVPNKGNDCFYLIQSGKALSCNNGVLAASDISVLGDSEAWTLLAMELVEGFTIPGTPTGFSDVPFSKYLRASGVNILGTGTVSDWAMLRVKLIVENMVGALKSSVNKDGIKDKEVIVISGDDSSEELARDTCLGVFYDTEYIEKYRGAQAPIGPASFCFVTEELMAQKGHFKENADPDEVRMFDQVVHEFGHLIDYALDYQQANDCPVSPKAVGLEPKESFAISVQSWFDSMGIIDSLYFPATRKELEDNYKDRYDYLAKYFDPKNLWMPPIEPRSRFEIRFQGDDLFFYDGYFIGDIANAANHKYAYFSEINSIGLDGTTVDDLKINGKVLGKENSGWSSTMDLNSNKYIAEVEAHWKEDHILYIKITSNQNSHIESGSKNEDVEKFHIKGRISGIGVYYDDDHIRGMHFDVEE